MNQENENDERWHCNECGHNFTRGEAETVEDDYSGECVIACPKCWANVLDKWDSLECLD